MRRPLLSALLLAAIGCRGPDAVDSATPDADAAQLDFAGIASVTWDGADGLIAAWQPAVSTDDEAAISYLVSVEPLDGSPQLRAETTDPDAHLTGLDDGEYRLTVEAIAGAASAGGEVWLDQLVGTDRLVYRAEIDLPGAMDVWGEGDVAAIAGGLNPEYDVLIADVSDPRAPQTLATIEGLAHVRDVELGDGLLFAAEDCQCNAGDDSYADWHGTGAWIYDLSDPSAPALLAGIGDPAFSIHNLTYAEGALYLSDSLDQRVLIYDVSEPAKPSLLGEIAPPEHGVHDQTWRDGVLYIAGGGGFSAWDVSDPSAPTELWRSLSFDTGGFHNIAPTEDGAHALTSEEVVGGSMRIWDVSDPADIREVAAWQTDPDQDVHNVYVRGDYALAAWYTDGVLAFDISDPSNPVSAGQYDTYSGEEGPIEPLDGGDPVPRIQGAWGLWPDGDHLIVGDTERGLITMDLFPTTVTASP